MFDSIRDAFFIFRHKSRLLAPHRMQMAFSPPEIDLMLCRKSHSWQAINSPSKRPDRLESSVFFFEFINEKFLVWEEKLMPRKKGFFYSIIINTELQEIQMSCCGRGVMGGRSDYNQFQPDWNEAPRSKLRGIKAELRRRRIIPLNCPHQRDIIRIKDITTDLREGI